MAASSNETDQDICNVLDKEEESDVFSEESDDFLFDTSEEESDRESDTSNVVHESEPYGQLLPYYTMHGPLNIKFAIKALL